MAKKIALAIARALAWALVVVVALALSIAYHLQLHEVRNQVRELVVALASNALRGDLEIGSLDEITLGEVVASDVRVLDEQGRTVITAPHVVARPDFGALFHDGTIHIASGRIESAELVLYVVGDDGLELSFIRAFEPANPGPAGGTSIHLVIDNLDLANVHAHGDVPRYRGLDVQGLSTLIRIEVARDVTVDAYRAAGQMIGPYPGTTEIDNIVVHFDTNLRNGLTAYVRVHRDEARATADVRVDRPAEWTVDTPRVRIDAHADPMCAGTLTSMGFPQLESLAGCARGWAHIEGPADALVLHASLATDAGDATVSGSISTHDEWAFSLATMGLDLHTLIPAAPDVHVAGNATITLISNPSDPARALVTLSSDAFVVDGWAIPGFEASGAVTGEAVLIERVQAHHLRGQLDVRGRVGFDGRLDLQADIDTPDIGADPNVARLVPGAHGALRAHLSIQAGPDLSQLTVDGNVDARGFRYGPLRADSLRGHVWAREGLPLPQLSLGLTGDGVVMAGIALGHATMTGRGGGARPLRIRVRSSGAVDLREASVDATVTRLRDGSIAIALDSTTFDVGLGRYTSSAGTPTRIVVHGDRIDFGEVDLHAADGSTVHVSGVLAPSGVSDFHFSLHDYDLSTIASLLPPAFARLTGRLNAEGALRGRLADPDLAATGDVHDASFDGQRGLAITHYDIHYANGTTNTLIDGSLGSRGAVHIEGAIHAPFAVLTNGRRVLDEAVLDSLEIDVDRANVAFITPFFGQRAVDLSLGGRVTAAVVLNGHPTDVDVSRAVVILDNFGPEGWTPIRGKALLSYVADELRVERVWIADPIGELLLAEAGANISLVAPPADLAGWLARLADAPWWIAARIEPRRLDGWPRPLGKTLPRGIIVGGSMTLVGSPTGASGSLEAIVRWDEPASAAACGASVRPSLQIHALTDNDVTQIRVDGFIDGRDVVHASAEAPTHVHDWLGQAYVELPPTAVGFHVHDLRLESLPWTCAYASGISNADLEVTLGSDEPALDGTFEIIGLRFRDPESGLTRGTPVHAAGSFATEGTTQTMATLCLLVSDEAGPRTRLAQCPTVASLEANTQAFSAEEGEVALAISIPITFAGQFSLPSYAPEAALFAWADFQNAHLGPVLTRVPGFVDADVVANGTVSAQGPFDTAVFAGGLDLRAGHARVASVGQHLHGIEGVLRFEPHRIVLPSDRPLVVHDGDGTTELTGEMTFAGLDPSTASLTLVTDRFPVRREGATLASLTGTASVAVTVTDAEVDIALHTEALSVALPQSLAGSVQSLDRRREVLIVGDDAPELADGGHARFPYHIHVDAPRFTVTRNDFDARVRTDIDVTYDDPDLTIQGLAEIIDGTFEVLGKRFTVQRGAILFDGGPQLDPAVSVVAVYALPGRRGATVTITVSGHLSGLSIDFSSTESTDTGEILALLISGRTSRPQDAQSAQQAGDQTANFIAGLTAGILTLGLQQQFGGDFVPNVAIEAGGTGAVGVRVGFNADWIIPDFLRGVVLDAYLEGFFATASSAQQQQTQQSGSAGGVGGGASMELQLPFNGVLSGTYVPPTSWGADLVWEP